MLNYMKEKKRLYLKAHATIWGILSKKTKKKTRLIKSRVIKVFLLITIIQSLETYYQ